ncbi:hypothetical protein EKPV-NSW-ORF035 [Eastern grey kangaroopox virus]|uniref:Uncharacterized protein n=1 Tax=Eastern grey kangaroopox virus TaxID=2042482 RepID=A0A345Z0P5_9POXV|nr:hypothetical protein EKPV-NSW-ORF035 [Eastern grey kangaroopox virus]
MGEVLCGGAAPSMRRRAQCVVQRRLHLGDPGTWSSCWVISAHAQRARVRTQIGFVI